MEWKPHYVVEASIDMIHADIPDPVLNAIRTGLVQWSMSRYVVVYFFGGEGPEGDLAHITEADHALGGEHANARYYAMGLSG